MADDTVNQISGGIFFSAVIQGRDITVHLPPEVTPALSGLPPRSTVFAGRQHDLDETLSVLAPHELPPDVADAPVGVVAIAGMPGVGKTELAIQAARAALRDGRFPGGALFIDMIGYDPERHLEPAQALDGLLRALGMPGDHIPASEQDRARLYASLLAKYAEQGRRILVMIDNVSSAEQVTALLPTDEVTRAIVTSRDSLGMPRTRLLDLNVLTIGASVDVLDRALHVARPGDTRVVDAPTAADQIAGLCGGLPLALQIIAALLAEDPGRSLPMMVADLSAAASRLDEMQIGERAVRAAFDLSYQRLDPQHARLFRLLPVNPGPDILIASTAALAGTDSRTTRHDLEALARAHLIERSTRQAGYRRWRMHDLIRLYATRLGEQHADTDDHDAARDRLLSYDLRAAATANAYLWAPPGTALPRTFTGRDDALQWLDAERANLVAAVRVATVTDRDDIALRLPLELAQYLGWRRRFDDELATITIGVNAARRLGDRRAEGDALIIIGIVLQETRRFRDAITALRNAIAIFHETGDRPREGAALINLGLALQEEGPFDEAVTVLQEAVAVLQEVADRGREGAALSSLGGALQKMRRVEEAVSAHQAALGSIAVPVIG